MSDIVDLSCFRLRRQLRQSVAILGNSATGANGLGLPPVPNAGLHCGDFVRLGDGSLGWIREQHMVGGKLRLTVSAGGRAVRVMAENVTPVSSA